MMKHEGFKPKKYIEGKTAKNEGYVSFPMVVDHLHLFLRQGPLIKLPMTFDQSAAEQLAAEAAHAMQQADPKFLQLLQG